MKKKYIIQVYDDGDNIIHTEEIEETAKEIKKVVNTISEMVGKEYKILYEVKVEKEV